MEILPAQTVLGAPSLVFFPPARSDSLKRSPRYAFGCRHSLKEKLLRDPCPRLASAAPGETCGPASREEPCPVDPFRR